MKPTLLVLAAGMGSRYGSLKQMDGAGPHAEIIDYSVYDAIRAGFGRVVFVIRHSFGAEFMECFAASRFGGRIQVGYVFQELDSMLPQGYTVPAGREKPWGTNHAVLVARDAIREPFAVVNADDFYGMDAIGQMGSYLSSLPAGSRDDYAMVGYRVGRTLSENGTVSRGVCSVSGDGYLQSMVERTKIMYDDNSKGVIYIDQEGAHHPLAGDTPVSMNLFGFTPDYFSYSAAQFRDFLDGVNRSGDLKAEYFIPLVVNGLIGSNTVRMKVLPTNSDWFGVTYKEDRPDTVRRIRELITTGVYPEKLWK